MSSEFGQDYGLIHEAVVTGRKVGANKDFWAALAHSEELFAKVVAFVATVSKVVFRLTSNVERNMEGWTCVESVEAGEGEFEPILQEFLQPGEARIGGEEMVRRAKKQGGLTGLRHAEAMLRDQDKIPADWRKYYIVFPEVWQYPDGRRSVFYLFWVGERWYLRYFWLEADFISHYRLVASRK